MAKLKSIEFKRTAATGEVLSFVAPAMVSNAGEFSLGIPQDVASTAQHVLDKRVYGGARNPSWHTRVRLTQSADVWWVKGSTLEHCKDFVEAVIAERLASQKVRELVLVYATEGKVAYVKDDRGQLYPNGYACSEAYHSNRARWHGTLHATRTARHYQVGLVARVLEKTTYTRGADSSVKYAFVNDADLGPAGRRLNSWVGVELSPEDQPRINEMRQMPYTEEAAAFFYDAMHAMCTLADRLESFFGSEEVVQKAIQERQPALPLVGIEK